VLLDRTERFLEAACESFATELGFEYSATRTMPDAVRASLRDIRFNDIQFLVVGPGGRPVLPLDDPASLGSHAATSRPPTALLRDLAATAAAADSTPVTVTLPDTDADYHAALRRTTIGGTATPSPRCNRFARYATRCAA
jgi:hypothetical protein